MKNFNPNLLHPKTQLTQVIGKIYRDGMTTTSGGNISIMDENGDMWVTPSAIDKGKLTEDDIICVKKDGSIVGKHKPSSEYPFHKAIYDARPEIKAVIHAHPPALVSFSIVREIPNTNIIPQAKKVCGKIGYAEYELPGSEALGAVIAKQFIGSDYMAVIMENHGTVLGGTDMLDAYTRFETLEFCCQTIINAKGIGNPTYLTDEQIKAYEAQMPEVKDCNTNVVNTSIEKALRSEIVEFVHRACRQNLMISSFGTISMRAEGNDFLITPTGIARWDLKTEDIVQIKDGKPEEGKTPSRSTKLHQMIYEQNPNVNTIIITQSPYLMAYGTTGVKFDVRTIPESWIFLQDVPCLPIETQFQGNTTIPEMICDTVPAVLVANNSFLVTGGSMMQAFDRLEVAEFSAKSLVIGAPLGKMVPINDEQVEDLRKKFLS
ncbi:aldolase [Labilibaculum manganireducens]|uniref:Aldolase n=1 Tax=Labilibaculum manganireducens TaxID=1940525 RepID=A0A2N3IBT8_9BACT|nr:class II aldolase/adducin family protein [Labilibaculum manganireducens]PKQ67745.1 aldolase [Labilibaculum manganireducens]